MKEKGSSFTGSLGFVGSSRKRCRSGEYLAFSVSVCKGRRGIVSSGLSDIGGHVWICIADYRYCNWKKNKTKCAESIWNNSKKMEVSGVSDVSGSYTDHDVLFGDRRVGS